jgi:hypothetical protein
MSTHQSTDPWRKNLETPRSTREAFGKHLADEQDYSKIEKAVILVCSIVLVLLMYFTR